MNSLRKLLSSPGVFTIAEAPGGYDALVLGQAVAASPAGCILHVARDDARLVRLAEALAFFHPDVACLALPAWDCLPYDRVSPNPAIVSQRMDGLTRLAGGASAIGDAVVVLTTVNALLQRVPPRDTLVGARFEVEAGRPLALDALTAFLERNGYARSGTVMEPGEYAPRGGLIDVFPSGAEVPLRVDLFGVR